MNHLPRFYEIFPYGMSRSGNVIFNKKLLLFQTTLVLGACTTAAAITFGDSYVILKQKQVALYLIYIARRLAFVITILISYFSIIDMKFTARRLVKFLHRTAHYKESAKTLHSRRMYAIDTACLLVMLMAVVVQEFGNRSGFTGHVKIISNLFMNLIVYFTLSYYRRILLHIGDKFNSIDLNSNPQEISRRHAALYKASKIVVKMFSIPVLGIMMTSAIFISSNLMYMLGNRRLFWAQFTVSTGYLIYYIFLVSGVVIGSCSTVLKAANRVINHMVEICLTSDNPKTVKIFNYHSYLYGNLEFRPLGLVVLETQFLTQYFGAIISYVAISLDYLDYIHN